MLFKTPKTTPIKSLLWETGTLPVSAIIVMKKLNFYFHIKTLHDESIAKTIAEIQEKNNFPGLIKEVKYLLRKYEMNDVDILDYTKASWKKMMKETVIKYTRYEF